MFYLNLVELGKDIYIYINLVGGLVICGIGVYDVINFVDVDVIIIVVGIVFLMVFFVLMGGVCGKWIVFLYLWIMIY